MNSSTRQCLFQLRRQHFLRQVTRIFPFKAICLVSRHRARPGLSDWVDTVDTEGWRIRCDAHKRRIPVLAWDRKCPALAHGLRLSSLTVCVTPLKKRNPCSWQRTTFRCLTPHKFLIRVAAMRQSHLKHIGTFVFAVFSEQGRGQDQSRLVPLDPAR